MKALVLGYILDLNFIEIRGLGPELKTFKSGRKLGNFGAGQTSVHKWQLLAKKCLATFSRGLGFGATCNGKVA